MQIITGDALDDVARALGISGAQGNQLTEFEDGIVSQTLTINDLVRRGRTLAGSAGIFTGLLQTVHGSAGVLTASIAPYDAGSGLVVAPFPSPVPPQFDLWVIGASVALESGSPTTSQSILGLDNVIQAWGVDDSGSQVVQNPRHFLALWSSQQAIGTGGTVMVRGGDRQAFAKIMVRIPRQVSPSGSPRLAFVCNTDAAATWTCQIIFGVFPIALGQDAAR